MRQYRILFVLVPVAVLVASAPPPAPQPPPPSRDDELLEIQTLQQQKRELFVKINEAIDDSLAALAAANDSDSADGIGHMTELKKQLADLNDTSTLEKFDNDIVTDSMEFRRKLRHEKSHKEDIVESPFNNNKLLAELNKSPKKEKNRIRIQKLLDEWTLKRLQERQKIKAYVNTKKQLDALYSEKCPRYGQAGAGGKGDKRAKGRRKQQDAYPCCRKCCKMSYLGCM